MFGSNRIAPAASYTNKNKKRPSTGTLIAVVGFIEILVIMIVVICLV